MLRREVAKWILRNTIVSRESLTPEFSLRLITDESPLWMSTPESCPLFDPYWAFYWPGGQAMSRYILDNRKLFEDSAVFDFGCGCGSSSMAATISGATVLANDIDTNALIATHINYKINKVEMKNVTFSENNFLENGDDTLLSFLQSRRKSFIILGDMFYDSDFALLVLNWLKRMTTKADMSILVGDPDRHPLAQSKYVDKYPIKFRKNFLCEYSLPGYIIKQHYGFNTAKVFEIKLE